MVYFITDDKYVKIGVTNNITARLSQLQTGNSAKLKIINTIDIGYDFDIEYMLHSLYAKHNILGEWFNLTKEQCFPVIDLSEVIKYKSKTDNNFFRESPLAINKFYDIGNLIHDVAQEMINNEVFAVSSKVVFNKVKNIKGLSSYASFNKYILKKTKVLLKEDERIKPLKSEREYNQLKEFLIERGKGKTLKECNRIVRISNTTSMRFNKIHKLMTEGKLVIDGLI